MARSRSSPATSPRPKTTYDAFAQIVATRHADTLYSTDGTTVDAQVAALLRGERPGVTPASSDRSAGGEQDSLVVGVTHTIAVAESCTGGLLLARLTNPPGASEYVLGGVVAYSNEAKIAQVGVPRETLEAHGAVSEQVAERLPRARERDSERTWGWGLPASRARRWQRAEARGAGLAQRVCRR